MSATSEVFPFRHFGEQLQAVRQAALIQTGVRGSIDPRLAELQQRAVAAGGSEQVPADGGFLVAPEFSRDLVKRMYNVGDILSRCFQMPLTASNSIKFPQIAETSRVTGSRLGGVQAYAPNEADTITASKPAFTLTELEAHKIIGLIYLTDELVADSGAMNAWAEYAFALEMAFKLENYIVNGTGSDQPLGILNSGALITVPKEGSQSSATVVSNNIDNMIRRLWAPSKKNAVWLYHQDLLPQFRQLSTVVGAAGSETGLLDFADALDPFDRIAGIPLIPSEYCQVPGTPGDLILADFSRYVVAMRQDVMADVSIHVKFLTDETAFRFVMRVNGQPLDAVPVTPHKGTNTTSTFVALATR